MARVINFCIDDHGRIHCTTSDGMTTHSGQQTMPMKPKPSVAYVLFRSPVAEGVSVLHTCKNYKCCNPSHLRLEVQELPLNPLQASNAA